MPAGRGGRPCLRRMRWSRKMEVESKGGRDSGHPSGFTAIYAEWLVGLRNPSSPPYLRAPAMVHRSYLAYRPPTDSPHSPAHSHSPDLSRETGPSGAPTHRRKCGQNGLPSPICSSTARLADLLHGQATILVRERLADQSWGWPAAASSSPAHDAIHRPIGAHVNLDHPRGIIYSL